MKQRKYFLISFLIPSLLVGCIPPPDKTPPPVKTLPGQNFGSGGSGGGGGLIHNNVKFTPGSLWTTTAGQLLDTLPPSVGDKLIFFETATTGCTGTVTTAGTPADLTPGTALSCGTAPLAAAETIAITSSHTFQIGSTTYTSNTIGDRLTAGSDTYRCVLSDSDWIKGGIFRTGGIHSSAPTVAGESIARFAHNVTEFCQGTVVTNGVPATYGAATCGTLPMSTAYPVHVTSRFTFVANGVEYTLHNAAPSTMNGGGINYTYDP